ncbi:MAG: pyridoxamine 5'-phosphate oxidase family protein [Sulfurimonas sp.]|nr:pyridoxamine 5'-phosphate oxidase family protein [Sulfurimonas sp.]
MKINLQKIYQYLTKHHLLNLATIDKDEVSVCSLFYAFDKEKLSFVVASSDETVHIQNILINSFVAGSIAQETKIIGKIQGVQFKGKFSLLKDKSLKNLYFKTFPYALAMSPKLWVIKVKYFKMIDNTLGFGKKIIWQEASV